MSELYGIDPCAIARYPMYRGLSRLLGMHVPEVVEDLSGQAGQLASRWEEHNFFFFHHKDTDSNGEDGDFDRKVAAIEELDAILPELLEHQPDVLAVTGDHSTPSHLKSHSWHPVPVLISSPTCLPDTTESFSETAAMSGGLGQFRANSLMLQLLAHAQKLEKFGA